MPAIQAISIRHSVEDLVRCALREGRCRAGEDVCEGVLSSEMEVGRGPVREALLVLAEEGFVSHAQNRGFSVPRFTLEDCNKINRILVPLGNHRAGTWAAADLSH